MGGIKRTSADDWFSKCVRERANWTCEMCGTIHAEAQATAKCGGLYCSHLFSRGNWAVRFDPDNAFCHCTACHFRFGGDREIQRIEYEKVFGNGKYEIIREKKNDTTLGRMAKREIKEIAKHYMGEFQRMRKLRQDGKTGRIEFEGYF